MIGGHPSAGATLRVAFGQQTADGFTVSALSLKPRMKDMGMPGPVTLLSLFFTCLK
jgi:hypothetical protein